jgi:hypothetical protein
MNIKAMAVGFILLAPFAAAGVADAASPHHSLAVSNPAPVYGEKVTFSVITNISRPWVDVECFQNGERVYAHTNDYSPYSTNLVFTLGPTTVWQGGSASCVANLTDKTRGKYPNGKVLATTGFQVNG